MECTSFAMRLWVLLLGVCPFLCRGQVEVPAVDDYLRRGYHAVAVLGDRLYIDGGELAQRAVGRTFRGLSNAAHGVRAASQHQ
ncbi:hypothetical protein MAPG_11795 [Magnaporthiopsis poae ATCC 64411]|uniref:Uncharacterized protein n=1 Tax=Magnaporthiopsis poae (strain ATCC 64411 / 73-15) TaxID=644358 RepID=A0A0C4EG72_MAGP6|nr:hypothetical protein MAPG_11795 [Magnaporthiopsis poae ATCC 64411]